MSYSMALTSSAPLQKIMIPYENYLTRFSRMDKISQAQDSAMRITKISESLSLRYPLSIPYKKEKGYYISAYCIGSFVIATAEKSYSEMIKEFKEQIAYAWEYYALEEDVNLAESAKQVKNWLIDNIVEAQ